MEAERLRSGRYGRNMNSRTFYPSHREEIISALWLIAALLAWNGGIRWLAWLLFVKSAFDALCAVVAGIIEVIADRKPPHA